jgi:hypothetical protein
VENNLPDLGDAFGRVIHAVPLGMRLSELSRIIEENWILAINLLSLTNEAFDDKIAVHHTSHDLIKPMVVKPETGGHQ